MPFQDAQVLQQAHQMYLQVDKLFTNLQSMHAKSQKLYNPS
jgi:hypothetical protein